MHLPAERHRGLPETGSSFFSFERDKLTGMHSSKVTDDIGKLKLQRRHGKLPVCRASAANHNAIHWEINFRSRLKLVSSIGLHAAHSYIWLYKRETLDA